VTSKAKKDRKELRPAGKMTVGELRKAGLLDALLSIHRAPSEDYSLFGEHHARTEDRLTAQELIDTQQGNVILDAFKQRYLFSVDTGRPDPDLYLAKVRFNQQAIQGWTNMGYAQMAVSALYGAASLNFRGVEMGRGLSSGTNALRLSSVSMLRLNEGGVPASEGGVPASEGGVPASEGGVPASEGGVPASEGGVPASGDLSGSVETPLDPNAPIEVLTPPPVVAPEQAVLQMADRPPRLLVRINKDQTVLVRQSVNAARLPEGAASASAKTPRSNLYTSIGADVGEVHAYKSTLLDGDIGLAEPNGANRQGVDAVTAGNKSGQMRVYVDQYKMSTQGKFEKGKWNPKWLGEVRSAIENMKLAPEDAHLGEDIVKAYGRGDVYLRQFNISRSQSGQMRVTKASEVRVPVNSPLDVSKLLMKPTAPVAKPAK
jgi:hypothetical protein